MRILIFSSCNFFTLAITSFFKKPIKTTVLNPNFDMSTFLIIQRKSIYDHVFINISSIDELLFFKKYNFGNAYFLFNKKLDKIIRLTPKVEGEVFISMGNCISCLGDILTKKNGHFNNVDYLSERELLIIDLLSKELSTYAIAKIINRDYKTVTSAKYSIMRKLGFVNKIKFMCYLGGLRTSSANQGYI